MAKISLNKIYRISDDVVAREIEGELIIIPITSGIGDAEDEIFTLNGTGKAIWDKLDGNKNLKEIAKALVADFKGAPGEIEKDVAGLAGELLKRRILIEVK